VSGVEDLSGTILKGYHLGDRLGGGAHSAVYEARRGGRQWAVKLFDSRLEPDASLSERLRGEAAVMASVALPGVVPIHEAGRSGRLTFVASPLERAKALSSLMNRGPVDNERAWSVLSCLAEALDAAHQRGLYYRCLRPGHVLVEGRGGQVRLAEFGLASARAGRLALTDPEHELAEPQYLAPEQVEGRDAGASTDLYALAVLVFELLTNSSLRGEGRSADVLRGTVSGQPPSAHERRPELPQAIDRVLERALSRVPEERYASAGELLEAVVGLPDDASVHAVAEPPSRLVAPDGARLPAMVKARAAGNSMVAVLGRMGVPVHRAHHGVMLNAYFAALLRYGAEACGERWPEVLGTAGLGEYLRVEPPDDGNRAAPVMAASHLASAIETAFGAAAPEVLRQWGRLTTDYWIRKTQQLQDGEVTYMKPLRLRTSAHTKVEDALYVFTRNLDRIRGERLTTWKRVEKHQFFLVHYDNLTALGRRRPARACDFWTAALVQALRWGECANDWFVEEAECGCVTGTYDCVFEIRRVQS
jgi:Protein kinase domain